MAMGQNMSGKIFAAILVIGGSVGACLCARGIEPATDSCINSCAIAHAKTGAGYAAFDENIARIAVRAGVPDAESEPTTKGEWLSLYLLLSLRSDGKTGTSAS